MPAHQIKTYVEVQSLAQLTQFKNVNGEQVVRAYQFTPRLRDNVTNLLSALAGGCGHCIITGPRGVGKSHMLALIRSLTSELSLASIVNDAAIAGAVRKLADIRLFPLELQTNNEAPPDIMGLLREELISRESLTITFSEAEWEKTMSGERVFKLIKSKLPPDASIILFIDGLSAAMRSSIYVCEQIKTWLKWCSDHFRAQKNALIVTLDEDLIDGELMKHFLMEHIDPINLRDIADRCIFKKSDGQRYELSRFYDELKRSMPHLPWTREDFVSLFPIHPSVLEAAASMCSYSRSFSFFGFITAAASRAVNRYADNLCSLDELFDSFEFDLRKNESLVAALSAFDAIMQQGIPKLSVIDEKFLAKMLLKSLFIYSLKGEAVSSRKLSHTIMTVPNERDQSSSMSKINSIIDCFIATAPEAIEAVGEGQLRAYKFKIKALQSPEDIVNKAASAIADDDPRLGELLAALGGKHFPDWPFNIEGEQLPVLRAEMSLPWRGAMRRGIFKYGLAVEIGLVDAANESSSENSAFAAFKEESALPVIDLESDLDAAFESIGPQRAPNAVRSAAVEWDWQVSIVPILQSIPADAAASVPVPPTFCYWLPQTPIGEELSVLKKTLALRLENRGLTASDSDFFRLSEKLTAETLKIFHKLYLEGGLLQNPALSTSIPINQFPLDSDLLKFLSKRLSNCFASRYPSHPMFVLQLTDYEVTNLSINLFGGLNPLSSVVQSYAESYALPLNLVSIVEGKYKLDLGRDIQHPAVAELLQMVSRAEKKSLPMSEIYRTLRREPFGLQWPVQRLILLALIAGWYIELTDDEGKSVFNAPKVSTDINFRLYTNARIPETVSYSSKLLSKWHELLTGQDFLDLVSPQGRANALEALARWRENWVKLRLPARLDEISADQLTTRLWQINVICKRYFESLSSAVEAAIKHKSSLEVCLARISDAFNAKEKTYIKAVHELTLLVGFLDWLPFFEESKDYILSAERTSDNKIEAGRQELVWLITESHLLLEEEKRQHYEEVYSNFKSQYVAHYCEIHNRIAKETEPLRGLKNFLAGERWRTFELFSQLSVANRTYYRAALQILDLLEESKCLYPTEEILASQPFCFCSFRVNRILDHTLSIEMFKNIVEEGIGFHKRLLAYQMPQIKALVNPGAGTEAEKIRELFPLVSNGEIRDLKLSNIEALNELFEKTHMPLTLLPAVQLGGKTSKAELRDRFERWIKGLPEETGLSLEFLDAVGLDDD